MNTLNSSVILFLIDGLRPDALAQADTPVIDDLKAYGAWTLQAQTVSPSITLPCTASLFLGSPPEVHGITSNTWTLDKPLPGLIDAIADAGGDAAAFYNWEQLRDLSRPGALTISVFLRNDGEPEGRGDTELTELATRLVKARLPHFVFLYLGHTDAAGHAHGWMSEQYLKAVENADACIGRLLGAIQDTVGPPGERWRAIVTSDHGGHATGHGSDQDCDITIPLVLYGSPDLKPGKEIDTPVSIVDIAPTILNWLGLTIPSSWTGKPVGHL